MSKRFDSWEVNTLSFEDVVSECPLMIAEGAVTERIRRESPFGLDPHLAHAGFVYKPVKRKFLKEIYGQYIDSVRPYDLPMVVFTPTWRANIERLRMASLSHRDVNADCFDFLSEIRKEYGEYSRRIFIGGLIGCKGDSYKAEEALTDANSVVFHRYQVESLSNAGVDFLFGSTLPSVTEAMGIARAMASAGTPYILSFVVRPNGTLLDETSLNDAISTIDALNEQRPLGYMVNCVHPTVFQSAISNEDNASDLVRKRMLGLQANTSLRRPEELDGLEELETEEPDNFADMMVRVHLSLGSRILGGCCGTDDRHIRALVKKLCIGN